MSKSREPGIVFKWTNCCRLCLSRESTIDLFSEASVSQHFPWKIRTCLNFLIYSGDPMPRKICATCCMKLDNWFQFRKECIQKEKDLKKKLEPYKRISFVQEYFDKYVKYEKSSQDGSFSMDSMSEYDDDEEEEEEDYFDDGEMGDENEDVQMYSEYAQKEGCNSGLSDNGKVMAVSENFENKQNIQRSLSRSQENQVLSNALINPEIIMKENDNEARKSASILYKAEVKSKDIYNNNNVSKKFCGSKGKLTETNNFLSANKKLKALANDSNKNLFDQQETTVKTCSDCGVDFPSEERLPLHSCNVNEAGAESDDNDNFINPLSFVDTSLSEPTKEPTDVDGALIDVTSKPNPYKIDNSGKTVSITQWKCLVCSEYFKSMLALKQHYDEPDSKCSKADLKFECEVCKSIFETKTEFIEHQSTHIESINNEYANCNQRQDFVCDEDKQYSCSKCEQCFDDRELFDKHELVHNQQDLYNSIVTPQFTTFEGIEELEEFDEDDEKRPQNVVRCFRCGKLFNSVEQLESHELSKHKNPTPFFCRKCDLRFSARSQLLMHVRSHMRKSGCPEANSTNNTCRICNAKFFLASDLQCHLKMHKNSHIDDLMAVQNIDTYGDNKIDLFARFKCSVCSKIFVHSGSIIRHGKNLHKGQTVHPVRLKRPIFLMKRARSLSLPSDKNTKVSHKSSQEESCDNETGPDPKWEQDQDVAKVEPNLEFGTEKCPFCERVFKPTYLPRHIKRNHRGEVLDPQMLGRDIPDDSLVCRYCLKSCSNPHNRRVHESIHYPVKMQCAQCKICGMKFFNKSSYEDHIVGCKCLRCGKCNKIFFRHQSLKNHSCIVTVSTENKA